MKSGDLVEKFLGNWDLGKIGCLINIRTNGAGTTLAYVLVEGKIKPWRIDFVRKFNEDNQS